MDIISLTHTSFPPSFFPKLKYLKSLDQHEYGNHLQDRGTFEFRGGKTRRDGEEDGTHSLPNLMIYSLATTLLSTSLLSHISTTNNPLHSIYLCYERFYHQKEITMMMTCLIPPHYSDLQMGSQTSKNRGRR